ncbi:MAG: 2-hydroxy-3-oxopropionate reductase [Dehalococcoidia bacterium]|jgi:2-hydroxy-3-oxopropionate reductase|nr:2-hydroxy-3-oxopropionate reductase [Dehalococcoidia bacterium]|tara:strand:- start:1774 stop:2664 length:891 start_codon:yes stop_codon:yes gene_type:complete
MKEKIGFVGLGIMGKPMASNLLDAEYSVNAYDLISKNLDSLLEKGIDSSASPKEVAENSDVIIVMVQNSPQSENAILGENGILNGASKGNLIIDMSSISPLVSQKISNECEKKGVDFIDAPVSGGEPGAIEGTLAIMVGGNSSSFERAKPVFEILGSSSVLCGDIGAGNFTKLANQIIVGANIHALSEALVLTTKAGLDPETVFNAIKGGLAGSNVMNTKAPMMFNRNFDPGFRIELHLKDITNAMQTANELNIPLQVTANLHQVLTSLVLHGKGKLDHSGILQFVEDQSNIEVKK